MLKELDLGEYLARRGASGDRSIEDFSSALKAWDTYETYQQAPNEKWDSENGDGSDPILTLNFDSRN